MNAEQLVRPWADALTLAAAQATHDSLREILYHDPLSASIFVDVERATTALLLVGDFLAFVAQVCCPLSCKSTAGT